ncbi:hypothetical protein TKK_0006813 [Trichogramma kaykai]|uniref:Uncharacterized protein n=1 Tax=Trichogramma kaykai TaxID=54128 RepID=A0ABD2XCC0_9HYME
MSAIKRPCPETAMEVEVVNGVEGKSKQRPPKRKRVNDADIRKVAIPAHRYTPLKENWLNIFTPIVTLLKVNVRCNLKTRNVEIKLNEDTPDIANLQKAADFVKADTD